MFCTMRGCRCGRSNPRVFSTLRRPDCDVPIADHAVSSSAVPSTADIEARPTGVVLRTPPGYIVMRSKTDPVPRR